jgi:hypothetical protein
MSDFKNQRGFWENFFEILGLKNIYSVFSQNHYAGGITNKICILQHCSMAPLFPGHG